MPTNAITGETDFGADPREYVSGKEPVALRDIIEKPWRKAGDGVAGTPGEIEMAAREELASRRGDGAPSTAPVSAPSLPGGTVFGVPVVVVLAAVGALGAAVLAALGWL